MAQLFNGQAFNAAQVDPSNHFEAVPAGDYEVMVVASELKMTKDGNGQYLQLELQIQNGQFHGRKLFDRLNLHNNNAKAVEIAQRQLSQLCHAIGVMQVMDSEQLHFKPCIARVAVRSEPGRDPSNEIKGYKVSATVPGSMATSAQQPAAPFAAPTGAPPAAPAAAAPAGFGAGAAAPWMSPKKAA